MNRRDHFPHPDAGFLVVHQLAVRDCARSRDFYRDVLGGVVVMDSPSFSLLQLANGWPWAAPPPPCPTSRASSSNRPPIRRASTAL